MEYPQDNGPAFRINWPQTAMLVVAALIGCLLALLLYRLIVVRETTLRAAQSTPIRRPRRYARTRPVYTDHQEVDGEDDEDDEESDDPS